MGCLTSRWSNGEDTVERTITQAPEHISMYSLTLEDGTPLKRWVQQGALPEPDADLAADMYDLARRMLRDAGYRHYEISNWSREGRESKHNLAYWRNLQWLGVGPGAHSSLRGGGRCGWRPVLDGAVAARVRQQGGGMGSDRDHLARGDGPANRVGSDR